MRKQVMTPEWDAFHPCGRHPEAKRKTPLSGRLKKAPLAGQPNKAPLARRVHQNEWRTPTS